MLKTDSDRFFIGLIIVSIIISFCVFVYADLASSYSHTICKDGTIFDFDSGNIFDSFDFGICNGHCGIEKIVFNDSFIRENKLSFKYFIERLLGCLVLGIPLATLLYIAIGNWK